MGDDGNQREDQNAELSNILEDDSSPHDTLRKIVVAKSKEQVQDIYRKVVEALISQKSRKGPATCIMAISIILVVCGILMAIIVGIFNNSKFVEAVKPLRNNKPLVISA